MTATNPLKHKMKPKFDNSLQMKSAKDIDRIMSYYDPDVVFFDVKPPFQTNGADAFAAFGRVLALFPQTPSE